jgi:hypothetical protein
MRIGKQNFFPQVCENIIIHVEAPCDGPIGHPPLALEQCEHLLQDGSKVHGVSFPFQQGSPSRTRILYSLRLGKTMLIFHPTA